MPFFSFGSQQTHPSRLAFAIKTQIRKKPRVWGSGPSSAWPRRAGLVAGASLPPGQSQLGIAACPARCPARSGRAGLRSPDAGQRRARGREGGSRGGDPAPGCWPRQRLSPLLAFAGAAVAPGQPATMRWKEEETALFCPKPRN